MDWFFYKDKTYLDFRLERIPYLFQIAQFFVLIHKYICIYIDSKCVNVSYENMFIKADHERAKTICTRFLGIRSKSQ